MTIQTPTTSAANSARRNDLDWLRVLAILVVFVFHSLRFFDTGGWHVKNGTTHFGVQVLVTFLGMWMMPLIFVLSGASVYYALGSRSASKFVKDRSLRLLVPLIAGILTHIILQVYFEAVTQRGFTGTFWQFIPHYFDGLYGFGGNFAWMGLHLWYLEVLFAFSLVTLPLFMWLRGSGAKALAAITKFLARGPRIYLLGLPIMALAMLPDPGSILGSRAFGGWNLPAYLCFFLYGFLLVSNEALERQTRHRTRGSLALGIIVAVLLFFWWGMLGDPSFGSGRWYIVQGVLGLGAWAWIMTLWGRATQRLTFSNGLLRYAGEAVLPFYILHQRCC
jgi:peptidoglycan/LPS O-acetylase OafA/YrhL